MLPLLLSAGAGGQTETVQPTVEYSPATTRTGTPTWVPIGTAAKWVTKLGRGYETDSMQAGTATFTLDASGGDLTPLVDAGPDTDRQIRLRVRFAGVDYVVHVGSTDNWPVSSNGQPYAEAAVTSTDGFDYLNNYQLQSAYQLAVRADNPSGLWPLSDLPGASLAGDQSGYGQPGAIIQQGRAGGSAAFGANPIVASDPATCLALGAVNDPFSGYPTDGGYLALPGPLPAAGAFTLEIVFATLIPSPPNNGVVLFEQFGLDGSLQWRINLDAFNTTVLWNDRVNDVYVDRGYADGAAHHLALTLSANRRTVSLYVDGVLATGATTTLNPITEPAAITVPATLGTWLGTADHPGVDAFPAGYYNGLLSDIAVYPVALSGGQISEHYRAMRGYVGETAGTRIARLLGDAAWYGGSLLAPGVSALGVQQTAATSALDAINTAAAADQGLFFIGADGRATFHSRRHRINRLSSAAFGADQTPISSDPLTVDRDRKFLVNDVTMSRDQGATVRVTDPVSIAARGTRGAQVTLGLASDAELVDAAGYYVHAYSQPRARIAALELDPYTHPALWPVVLSLQLGDRITLTALPSPPFPQASMDFFVESIAHEGDVRSWKTTLSLSPTDQWSYWALGDAVFGVLDLTTRLGY